MSSLNILNNHYLTSSTNISHLQSEVIEAFYLFWFPVFPLRFLLFWDQNSLSHCRSPNLFFCFQFVSILESELLAGVFLRLNDSTRFLCFTILIFWSSEFNSILIFPFAWILQGFKLKLSISVSLIHFRWSWFGILSTWRRTVCFESLIWNGFLDFNLFIDKIY